MQSPPMKSASNRKCNWPQLLSPISALVLVSFCVHLSDQLRFSSVQIPALVQRNTNFWLVCQFEFNRLTDNQLYSVKWYKRNEEFYRLIMSESVVGSDANANANAKQQQQQYFPQSGVNVMMSQSNATHVRLLNASVESEGTYACEISTQNLSTIRYEREIRVYALPQARLQLIGLRTRYSLGERVELNCSSDFARPAPALSWFINNRRILTNEPAANEEPNKWFEIETKSGAKFNEPTLRRASATLRFKLTSELVSAFGSSSISGSNSASSSQFLTLQAANQQHNQSNLARHANQRQRPPAPATSGGANLAKVELRLQCKYKLTEVSDVTFNELLVLAPGSSASSVSGQAGATSASTSYADDKNQDDDEDDDTAADSPDGSRDNDERGGSDHHSGRRNRKSLANARAGRASGIRIAKTPDNQVTQSKSPATIGELRRAFAADQQGEQQDVCQLGSLALTPEDPLIVSASVAKLSSVASGDDDPLGRLPAEDNGGEVLHWRSTRRDHNGNSRRRRSPIIPAATSTSFSVNCTTIAALVHQPPKQVQLQLATNANERRVKSSKEPSGYCAELNSRRKLAISGKFSTQTDDELVGANQARGSNLAAATGSRPASRSQSARQPTPQQHAANWHQTAYLSLGTAHKWLLQQQQRPATQTRDHDPAESSDSSGNADAQLQLQAPPLLEWFINNQEAPRSSVSIGGQPPELPTMPTPTSTNDDADSPIDSSLRRETADGASYATGYGDLAPLGAPPIDYAQYFANFDSRPMGQHLALHIPSLNERHFSQAQDSTLRLRCSSTQAQVLAVDSATAVIVAVAGDEHQVGHSQPSGSLSAWTQRQPQQQRQWNRKSAYRNQQNQPSASTGSGYSSLQPNQRSNGSLRSRYRVDLHLCFALLLLGFQLSHHNHNQGLIAFL